MCVPFSKIVVFIRYYFYNFLKLKNERSNLLNVNDKNLE